jgi:hypothetical protein
MTCKRIALQRLTVSARKFERNSFLLIWYRKYSHFYFVFAES